VSELDPGPLVTIVEDDAAIAEGLALNLKLQGYRTQVVADGETAVAHIENGTSDVVLLDITLPRQSGLQVLERVRATGNLVPVIVLSARQDEYDKVAALKLGADDYVTKPFALAELMARIEASLRRARMAAHAPDEREAKVEAETAAASAPPESRGPWHFGEIVVDGSTRTVTRAGQPVGLTHLEFELLSFFCRSAGRVWSREELLREVWGLRHSGQARTVDNFLAQLRAKLEADPEHPRHLLTVRGSGYRFDPG
jgi:two-component system alkaline phosphatase synthesis response regulator PhoP